MSQNRWTWPLTFGTGIVLSQKIAAVERDSTSAVPSTTLDIDGDRILEVEQARFAFQTGEPATRIGFRKQFGPGTFMM